MYKIKILLLFIALSSVVSTTKAVRILGVFPYPSKSHTIMFDALMEELALRNHQVDIITHFPNDNLPTNCQVVVNLNGTKTSKVNNITLEYLLNLPQVNLVTHVAENLGNKVCDFLGLNEMQAFVKNPPRDPPYDLVITHALAANCYMGFGHFFKVPVIAIATTIEHPWINEFTGNDDNLAYVTNFLEKKFDRHNFWYRLKNVLSYHWNVIIFNKCTDTYQTEAMRKYLSHDIPNIREVEKSVALTLTNRNSLMHGMKPMIQSVVDVTGIHIKPNKSKLSPQLKKWLDESTDGVIYFTFGSMILIESFPVDTIVDMYKSFAKISPTRVLIKIANKTKLPAGLPDNVETYPWIPQQAVLAHKNVRVYITHGGMFGSQEALYFGVPMIGIPLYGDQALNVAAYAAKKMAIEIPLENLSSKSLDQALDRILNDPMYRENAKMYSAIFRDEPMKPTEKAVFWIEYIIRHKGNPNVSPALDMQWWQLALLDVYGFILCALIVILTIVYYTLKLVLRQLCPLCYKKPKVD